MTCGTCGAEGGVGRSITHHPSCEFYQPPLPTAPATSWPGTVEPRCPTVCCFRLTCATSTQVGILTLWAEGRITKPDECTFYERRARVHRETTGCEPPATAEALLEQLREGSAIQPEDGA